jgi:archaellin
MKLSLASCLLLAAGSLVPEGAGAVRTAGYGAVTLQDLHGRYLLGLHSDDFTTQMYAKTDPAEHPWVRNHKVEVRWNDIEPSRDSYNWGKLDSVVSSITAKGSDSILFLLNAYVPSWARDPAYGAYSNKAPPKNMADWYGFCEEVAKRYGSKVDFYEIWNEPGWDIDSEAASYFDVRFFGGQVETDYLPMLQAAYDALKKNDPVAFVICGALPSTINPDPTAGTDLYRLLFDDVNRPGQDVSLHLKSDRGIIAERPMYFNYMGKWTGGHDVVGADAPRTQWLFAEGYTGDGFDEWLCLQNPNSGTAVTASVTYYFADGSPPLSREYTLEKSSRFTVKVNDEVGSGRDVSIKVTTPDGKPVVAERPMYFDYRGAWTGGHDVMGAADARTQWLFAEGYTGPGFEEWLCLLNPNASSFKATVTYYFGDGTPPLERQYDLASNSRRTIYVNEEVGSGRDVSIKVTTPDGKPVVAERPIYFDYRGGWTGGHDVMGAAEAATAWYFAEGYTGPGFEEWLCLLNPNASSFKATVTYYFGDGTPPLERQYDLASNSRRTIYVNEEVGSGRDVSIKVTTPDGKPVVAERPMYFDFRGWMTGGHDVMGAAAPAQDWYFAEGCTGYGIEEWLCLQNPGGSSASVDITFMMRAGHTFTRRVTVPANSRLTVNVNQVLGFGGNCDGVAVHPYKEPKYWGQYYGAVRGVLDSIGCSKELLATEIGWPNHSENPPGNSEEGQRAAIGEVGIASLWDNGCRKIWVYKDVDEPPGGAWDYNYYGLFDYTGSPHPAWWEYRYWQTQLPDYENIAP